MSSSGELEPDDGIAGSWLALYVDHCRRTLSTEELAELIAALEHGAPDPGSWPTVVSSRTADESKWLVVFLAGIRDERRRARLLVEARVRLRQYLA